MDGMKKYIIYKWMESQVIIIINKQNLFNSTNGRDGMNKYTHTHTHTKKKKKF